MTDEALARYSQICRLGAPDPVALSDLRRWAQSSLPQSNSPDMAFLSKPELGDDDLVTLGEGSSQKTWIYRLVETLAWRWLSTVSKCLRNLYATGQSSSCTGGTGSLFEAQIKRNTARL